MSYTLRKCSCWLETYWAWAIWTHIFWKYIHKSKITLKIYSFHTLIIKNYRLKIYVIIDYTNYKFSARIVWKDNKKERGFYFDASGQRWSMHTSVDRPIEEKRFSQWKFLILNYVGGSINITHFLWFLFYWFNFL